MRSHTMLAHLLSSPRVRLGCSTHTQGLPSPAPYTAFAASPTSPVQAAHATTSGGYIMKDTTDTPSAAFVGINWADRTHDRCLQPAGCDTREFSVLAHRPERRQPWAEGLRQRFQGRLIAVCLELTTGPLVSALQRYELLVLVPVNPTRLAKSRATVC